MRQAYALQSSVMTKAWELFREAGIRTMKAWSEALRRAWAIVKSSAKKEESQLDLDKMSIDELENLLQAVKAKLEEKKAAQLKEFTFSFNCTADSRKGKPYAARLYLDENGKLHRQFFELERMRYRNEITVSGQYKAKAGDIVEERHGGSWKNDYRYWFLVTEDGELVKVADIANGGEKARVLQYLRGEITAEELLK